MAQQAPEVRIGRGNVVLINEARQQPLALDDEVDADKIKAYDTLAKKDASCDECGVYSYCLEWGILCPIGGLNEKGEPRVGGVCTNCYTPFGIEDWYNDVLGIKFPLLGSGMQCDWYDENPVPYVRLPQRLRQVYGDEDSYLKLWHQWDAEDKGMEYISSGNDDDANSMDVSDSEEPVNASDDNGDADEDRKED